MRLLIAMVMLASAVVYAGDEKKELTPAEKELQESLEKEYGDFGKEYKSAKYHKELTFQALKASKKEMNNKKVQYEGTYMGFNDNFPAYIEDSGYSGKRYHYILVNGFDLPVMSRRNNDMIELLGKLKKGVKVKIYGRVKDFRKSPKHGLAPSYCVELSHIQVLELEPKKAGVNKADKKDKKDKKTRRPFRRR